MSDLQKQYCRGSWLWLIRVIGVIAPRRLRSDWRQEWEAELRYRETLLAEWDRLGWRNRLALAWHSLGAFMDALWLQPRRLEEEMFQDLRYGGRMLVKSPGFTFVVALTLALGIGANTAIFSVIEAVMLRPLPYHNSERLCVLWKSVPARNIEWDWTSYPTIRDWREQSRSFEDMAAIFLPSASEVTLQSDGGPERIQGSKVTGNFFEILGVKPLLGRAFSDDEARRGSDVVVLSYGFWQRRFGGDGAIVGRRLHLDNRSATIIGVMPPNFQFPDKNAQLWLLLSTDHRWAGIQKIRLADAFSALARLKPGVSIEEARAEMNVIAGRLAQQYPATDANLGIRVVPLFDQIVGAQLRRALDSRRRSVVRTAHRLLEHRELARGPKRGAQERTGYPRRAWRRRVAITQTIGDRKCSALSARRARRPLVRPLGAARVTLDRPGRPASRGWDRDQWDGAGFRWRPLLIDRRRVRSTTCGPDHSRKFARESE